MERRFRIFRVQVSITNLLLLVLAVGFFAAWIREAGGMRSWWGKQTRPQIGLEGYDPVFLLRHGRWERGSRAYASFYEGQLFRFVSATELAEFQDSPAKYAPVLGGRDIVIANDENRLVDGDRRYGLLYHGRIYLFADNSSMVRFEASPEQYFQRLRDSE